MRNNFLIPALLASVVTGAAWSAMDEDVRVSPLSMGTVVDAGQVVKGSGGSGYDETIIQRTSVWVTQELTIGSRLDVHAGAGGIFWYTSPRPPAGSGEPGRFLQLPKFGTGITRVDMIYRFSDDPQPMFTLQAGYFPYKYNPDAGNLGEYLLRSGTYPGFLTTGGWNLLGAGYMMQGLRLNVSLWDGKFQSDFLLPMEQDMWGTNGDLSPTYVATVTPVPGIELGGGASCYHCISVKPSRTSPEIYVKPSEDPTTYGYGSAVVIDNPSFNDALPVTEYTGSNPRYIFDSTSFYTFQGVKLMGRVSFDPKAYVPMPMMAPGDLKIFAEVALLGVKNYPFYYEKRTERMPVMFGINVPTFKVLDQLTVQAEYYGSRFPNAVKYPSDKRVPMPVPVGYDANGILKDDPNLYDFENENVSDDNWKWSVLGSKQFVRGLRVIAQVANDHMRLPNEWGTNSATPITTLSKDWYYLLRLEMGI